jgi:hypothetical protein
MIKSLLKLILGITILVIAVALGPLLIIWAINTLFPVSAIPYTWQTWAAAFVLSAPFSSGAFKKKS